MTRDCILTMRTRVLGEEETSDIRVPASYERSGNRYRVIFEIEKDRCSLYFDDYGLTYERSGALSFSMDIREGTETEILMKTGYGDIPMKYTVQYYKAEITERDILIKTEYTAAENRTYMEISIKNKEELL